jgi:hypothetical protein
MQLGVNMVRVEESVIVDLPVEKVFASGSDPETHLQWETTTIKVDKLSQGPMGKGTRHRGSIRFLGQIIDWESVVSEFVPDSKVEYRIASGSMQFREKWNFTSAEQSTRVTFIFEGDLQGLLKFISPIAVLEWKRQARKDLAKMKNVLELKN